MEPKGMHLTFLRIIRLLHPESILHGPSGELEEHLRICPERSELKEQCAATMAGISLLSSPNITAQIDCPAPGIWTQFAARLLPGEQMEPVLEHLSTCDHCGVLLKEALDDIQSAPYRP